jgi:hypothetical protein
MALDGTYKISVFTGRGEMKDQFTIKTSGNTLTGTYMSEQMGTLPFKDVKVSGNTVEWTLYFAGPPGGGAPPAGGPPAGAPPAGGPPPNLPNPMKIPFKVTFAGKKVTGKLSMAGDTPFDVKGEKVA